MRNSCQFNLTLLSCLCPSAAGHLDTPLRKSPISLRKSNMPPASARKEANAQAIRIVEVLQQNEEFYRRLSLSAGLRSMTAKQFIHIIDYCHKVICGDPLGTAAKGDPSNEIIEFLKRLDCPYIVNKSLFKSPAAPHTFDQSVSLLNWLVDFIPPQFPDGAIKYYDAQFDLFEKDERLPDVDFTRTLQEKAKLGYRDFLEGHEDKYKENIETLSDEFVKHHSGGQFTSRAAIEKRTKELANKIVELNKFDRNIPNERTFQVAESQVVQLEGDIAVLNEKLKKEKDQRNALKLEYGAKVYKRDGYQQEIEKIKEITVKQPYDLEQMVELRSKYKDIQNSVDLERKLTHEIKDAQNRSVIQLARQKRDKTEAQLKLGWDLDAFVREIAETRFGQNKRTSMAVLKKLVAQKPLPLPEIQKVLQELDPTGAIQELEIERQLQGMKVNEAKMKIKMLELEFGEMQKELNKIISSLEELKTAREEQRLSGEFEIKQLEKVVAGLRAEVTAKGEANENSTKLIEKWDEWRVASEQSIDEFIEYSGAKTDEFIVKTEKVHEILLKSQPKMAPSDHREAAKILIGKLNEAGAELVVEFKETVINIQTEYNQGKNELLRMPGAENIILQDLDINFDESEDEEGAVGETAA